MTDDLIRYDSMLKAEIAQRLSDSGFKFQREPKLDQIPADIGRYRPDFLIEADDNSKYLIEVKSKTSLRNIERYIEISKEVTKYKGWHFYIIDEGLSGDRIKEILKPFEKKLEILHNRIVELEKFTASVSKNKIFLSSLYLLYFANIESQLSLIADKAGYPTPYLPTRTTLDYLYSEGELTHSLYEEIINSFKLRNQIVHPGYSDSGEPNIQMVKNIQDKLQTMLEEKPNSKAEDDVLL